jgi:hypothetical protein
MWFEALTGFGEDNVDDVGAQFDLDDGTLTSLANGRAMQCGSFETPSLGELRELSGTIAGNGRLRFSEVVADVQELHRDRLNAGALFQVASQFNTLEMVSPNVTPEDGIDRYENDRTQGPACAIACGAGTIYRNYLVPIDGHTGQSASRQVNCLAELVARLGIDVEMRNGYALATEPQLNRVNEALAATDTDGLDELRAELRVGLQRDTEVTLLEPGHLVSQAFCSAMPVAYSSVATPTWEPFARLVLDAAYEATLHAGVINSAATGNRRVFLTLLGGGAFGNPIEWILSALQRALSSFADADLDVRIVSYGQPNPHLRHLLAGHGGPLPSTPSP